MDEQNNSNNEDYLNKLPDSNQEHPTIHEIEQRVKQQKNQAETAENEILDQDQTEIPDNETPQPVSQVGQSFAPEVAPPMPPEPQPELDESKEVPDYLKGADSPPPTGQSVHPAGTYQPKPGETAQSSVDGGVGVVQNMQSQATDLTKKSPLKIFLIVAVGLIVVGAVYFLLSTFVFNDATNNQTDTESVDSQLTTDVNTLSQSMQRYASENNGNYPDMQLEQIRDFAENYLPANFIDPRTEEPYQLVTDLPDKNSEIQYLRYAQCADNGAIEAIEGGLNKVAFRVYLSDSSLFCEDNSN